MYNIPHHLALPTRNPGQQGSAPRHALHLVPAAPAIPLGCTPEDALRHGRPEQFPAKKIVK